MPPRLPESEPPKPEDKKEPSAENPQGIQKPGDVAIPGRDSGAPPSMLHEIINKPAENPAERDAQIQGFKIAQTPTGFAGHERFVTQSGERLDGVSSYNQKTGERNLYVPNENGTFTPYRFADQHTLQRLDGSGETIALRSRGDHAMAPPPTQRDQRPDSRPDGQRPDGQRQDAQRPEINKPEANATKTDSSKPLDRPHDAQELNSAIKAQNDARLQLAEQFKNMDPRQRMELVDKLNSHFGPKGEGPHVLEGKVSFLAPGKLIDGKLAPGDPHLEGGVKGKGDAHMDGKVFHEAAEGKGRPEGLIRQIDGKLLAQLQNLGRLPELRNAFVDLINRFQDGKLGHAGKEGGLLALLQRMKPADLDGLKAWLTDSRKNPFDFKQLDGKVQQDISRIFDTLAGRGAERAAAAAMLDVKGLRIMTDALNPIRTMGEKGQTDFKVPMREMDPALQAIIARLQGKDAGNAPSERMQPARRDGRDDDGKPTVTIKDALTRLGDVNRTLGQRDQGARAEAEAWKSKQDAVHETTHEVITSRPSEIRTPEETKSLDSATDKEIQAQKARELEDERRKQEEEKDRLEKEREEKERLERERQERERLEKEKQEEKKKQADEERLYIVLENDTLNSISEKFFNTADNAQIIYDRNLNEIMLQDHKGKTYAKLYPRQRIMIPNFDYIDNFKKSMKSHQHINFGRVDYASAEEELAATFGNNWGGVAGASGLSLQKGDDNGEDEPVSRRSFSGKTVSEEERRANVLEAFGMSAQENKQQSKYNVHLGESLRSIAQKLYNSPAYWRLVALKNNLSTATDRRGNPLTQLRRGQQLILPDDAELESFARDPDAPAVLALASTAGGFELPRNRQCGYCKRDTLAMAVNCVACGYDMNTYTPGTSESEGNGSEGDPELPAVPAQQDAPAQPSAPAQSAAPSMPSSKDLIDQIGLVQLLDVTLTNQFERMNFSPEQNPPQQDSPAVILPQPPRDPHPLPRADLSRVELGFEQEADPLWNANKEPVMLDARVRVVECETMDGDMRCLLVILQLLSDGKWLTVFDYNVRPDEVVIHKYRRSGGRRMMKKSLPAKQSKQMAWNHFRSAWKSLCSEFWAS